jgi:predicted Zn-dependent peptidase
MRRITLAALAVCLIATAEGRAADEPSAYALSNGLRVRLVPLKGEKEICVLLGVKAGFCAEPAGLPHVAHVAEHLVVFGFAAGSDDGKTAERWFREGKANGETLPGFMYFDLHVEPGELEPALRVQAARLAGPGFDAAILTREVPRALGEIEFLERSARFGPAKFAFSAFVQAALHGQTEVPLKARTRALTVDDVRRFHAATFRADRAVLVVVGGFDPSAARQAIAAAFSAIPRPIAAAVDRPSVRAGDVTAHWDVATRHMIIGWPTPPADTPAHAALTVAADALSTRLMTDPALAPLGTMPWVTNDVAGLFLINVQAKRAADLDALKSRLLDQVARLATPEGLTPLQGLVARREVLETIRPGGSGLLFALSGQKTNLRTNLELQRLGKELGWGDIDVDAYARRVEAVEPGAVRAAVARSLTPEKAAVVRVVPAP